MPFRQLILSLVATLLCVNALARGQSLSELLDEEEDDVALASSVGPVAIVPAQRGLNASLISSSQHDSVIGWSEVLTPILAYRFNRQISVDVATPFFVYLLTDRTHTVKGKPVTALGVRRDVLSDTVIAVHYEPPAFRAGMLRELATSPTFSLIAPTGSVQDGLSAGRVAFNLTSHIESSLLLHPYIDLGVGTTSRRLGDRRIQKAQTAAGVLASFAVGLRLPLSRDIGLSVEEYEQLPLGDQTIYQTSATRRGRLRKKAIGKGLAEDNGINSSVDLPLQSHLTLSGFYSRSVRQHEDTGGFSLTWSLRGRPGEASRPASSSTP